ncbi:MAG: hypothetical protein ACKVOK_09070 [Flavobacteriales bacterium]
MLDSLPELIPAKSVEVSTPMDAAAQPGADVEVSLKNTEIQLQEEIKTSDIASTPGGQQQPNTITSQVHPAAAGSLLFGILSALCFVGLFITSFSPLALVIGLIAGLFLFAILAKWLSKRAFEDMYHARSRYSGRGLAAAGLALSVITVVAFLGLLAVILFGIGFASLA